MFVIFRNNLNGFGGIFTRVVPTWLLCSVPQGCEISSYHFHWNDNLVKWNTVECAHVWCDDGRTVIRTRQNSFHKYLCPIIYLFWSKNVYRIFSYCFLICFGFRNCFLENNIISVKGAKVYLVWYAWGGTWARVVLSSPCPVST
jgi:hypothetical protein